jgi:hypothetical protein
LSKTGFIPSKHGFHFPNGFVNHILTLFGKDITTLGRCGGMAYASLDYFSNSMTVPTCTTSDFGSSGVPADGTPLADYIYRRLLDSFCMYGLTFIYWNVTSDHKTLLNGKGIVAATKQDEWPLLNAWLDMGRPVVLGLISATGSLADCHQIVAYDYSLGPNSITISVYDNNHPDRDDITITSTVDGTNPHWNETTGEIWRAFFVEDGSSTVDYAGPSLSAPPAGCEVPPVVDFVLTSGVQPSSEFPFIGQPFDCGFSVKNAGPYPAHANYLYLSPKMTDDITSNWYSPQYIANANAAIAGLLGADTSRTPLVLSPGESYQMAKHVTNLNVPNAPYDITAGYYNSDSQWIELPKQAFPGSPVVPNVTTINVISAPTLMVGLISETQLLTPTPSGNSGYYAVKLSASIEPPNFVPTSYQWTVDGGTPTQQSLSGNPVQFNLNVGTRGKGTYAYNHNVKVIASDNSGHQATGTYAVQLPAPWGELCANYSDPNSQQVTSSDTIAGYIRTMDQTFSSVLVEAETGGLFSPITYAWTPTPEKVLAGGSQAVIQMPAVQNTTSTPTSPLTSRTVSTPLQTSVLGPKKGPSVTYEDQSVTVLITDAIGQTIQLQAVVAASVHSGGYVRGYALPSKEIIEIPVPVPTPPEAKVINVTDPFVFVSLQEGKAQSGMSVARVAGLPQGSIAAKQGVGIGQISTVGRIGQTAITAARTTVVAASAAVATRATSAISAKTIVQRVSS